RRDRVGSVRITQQDAERSGRLVVEARGLHFARGMRPIVQNADITIMRGDRVGIIGPNGSGKTTLINLLLGTLTPDAGTIRHGTNLEIAYFDQLREQLDPERSVFDSIADGAQTIRLLGNERHVNGYLQDFLFGPERARTPVKALSGGERNRLLLARLFTRAFNLLVMDEPTNDLDIDTLDLLEARLVEYGGTLLVVSHDREFLDHVVTSTLVLEGKGRVGEYVGGYTDWVRQRPAPITAPAAPAKAAPVAAKTPAPEKKRRLTFNEQAELATLPDRIDVAEQAREAILAQLADPAVLRDGLAAVAAHARLTEIDAQLATLLARWEALETQAAESR
ncbi:MAG: ATP-binding cassette domain-containing protein, partial [Gemmatimonadaceae bacterium]|nr:ATP-binding cassette domain-containing protein [Gemmatimonadaceae bacterium]